MKRMVSAGLTLMFLLVTLPMLLAADKGTTTEAEAMVKKAIAFMKANGYRSVKEMLGVAHSDRP